MDLATDFHRQKKMHLRKARAQEKEENSGTRTRKRSNWTRLPASLLGGDKH
ncbi:MAG: hypothetical protein GY775_11570 [Candidatus Scalindua sp.]|nr:hypothetical protein [Candidatus Scalindua sp.]